MGGIYELKMLYIIIGKEGLAMKITNCISKILSKELPYEINDAVRKISYRDIILIRITTDENITGIAFLTGLGVAYGSELMIINQIIQNSLKPFLIGEDPLNINKIWANMFNKTIRFGRKGAVIRAISGVDIALWDIMGKVAKLPLYKLLGCYQEQVNFYASGGFYTNDNQDKLKDEINNYIEKGYQSVKIKVGSQNIKEDVERVRETYELIDGRMMLMIDACEKWDALTAIRFMKKIEDIDLYFLEEPVPADDIKGFKKIKDFIHIPIAAGENEYTKFGFLSLIESAFVDIIQPDVTRVGGVTEWMKCAALAEANNILCIPHCIQEIHIHLAAASPSTPMIEYFDENHPLQSFISELFIKPKLEIINGYLIPPKEYGIGLEVNEDIEQKYLVR